MDDEDTDQLDVKGGLPKKVAGSQKIAKKEKKPRQPFKAPTNYIIKALSFPEKVRRGDTNFKYQCSIQWFDLDTKKEHQRTIRFCPVDDEDYIDHGDRHRSDQRMNQLKKYYLPWQPNCLRMKLANGPYKSMEQNYLKALIDLKIGKVVSDQI